MKRRSFLRLAALLPILPSTRLIGAPLAAQVAQKTSPGLWRDQAILACMADAGGDCANLCSQRRHALDARELARLSPWG